jgi:hypothetical protein
MKYKVGDRVYFAGRKWKVIGTHLFGLHIRNGKNKFNVTYRSVKPIVRCSNAN